MKRSSILRSPEKENIHVTVGESPSKSARSLPFESSIINIGGSPVKVLFPGCCSDIVPMVTPSTAIFQQMILKDEKVILKLQHYFSLVANVVTGCCNIKLKFDTEITGMDAMTFRKKLLHQRHIEKLPAFGPFEKKVQFVFAHLKKQGIDTRFFVIKVFNVFQPKTPFNGFMVWVGEFEHDPEAKLFAFNEQYCLPVGKVMFI